MKISIEQVAEVIEDVAEQEVMPRFQKLSKGDVLEKSGGELVTSADIACEKALSRRLEGLLPGARVLGEEAVAENPALMSLLEAEDPVWIIDPIDGTGNFAAGRSVFAVMVALVAGGETLAGWIHEPVRGRTASAEAGSGAFMAGERLQVKKAGKLPDLRGTLHASSFAPPELAARVSLRRGRVDAIKSLRCAGAEYLRLITGEMDFTLFTRLMPWDHAPGCLLQREAGGVAACFDRRPYSVLRYRDIGILMAPDERAWSELYETIVAL